MKCVIGLDIGTTACKAIALDDRGQVVTSTQEYYTLTVSQQGYPSKLVRPKRDMPTRSSGLPRTAQLGVLILQLPKALLYRSDL